MSSRPGKRRFRFILPGLYLLFAAYIWWDFTRLPPDGLANIGLMFATARVAIVGLLVDVIVGSKRFSLVPTSHGYLTDHAIYYLPAVMVTALLLGWLGRSIDRR